MFLQHGSEVTDAAIRQAEAMGHALTTFEPAQPAGMHCACRRCGAILQIVTDAGDTPTMTAKRQAGGIVAHIDNQFFIHAAGSALDTVCTTGPRE